MALTADDVKDFTYLINKAMAGENPCAYVTLDKFTRIKIIVTYSVANGAGFWFFIEYMDNTGAWKEYSTEQISAPADWVELLALPE